MFNAFEICRKAAYDVREKEREKEGGNGTNSLDLSIIAREILSETSHDRIFNAILSRYFLTE